jgi:hypothetical protein
MQVATEGTTVINEAIAFMKTIWALGICVLKLLISEFCSKKSTICTD